jgi:hypothetical protein
MILKILHQNVQKPRNPVGKRMQYGIISLKMKLEKRVIHPVLVYTVVIFG